MARSKSSDFIDFPRLFKLYLSKWYLFVISVAVCGFLGFVISRVKQPVYTVNANVLITQDKSTPSMNDPMAGAMSMIFGTSAYVEDEIFQVGAHSLYCDVVKKLGLYNTHYVHRGFLTNVLTYPDFPVDVTAPAELIDTLRTGISFKIKINEKGRAKIKAKMLRRTVAEVEDVKLPYTMKTPLGDFTVVTTKYYNPGSDLSTNVSVNGIDASAETLGEDVHSEIASKRSNVIALSINTTNPELGKAVLNQIMEQYNQRGIVQKRQQTALTAGFIDGRLLIISDDLRKSDREIQEYKQNKGIVDLILETKYQTEKKAAIEEKLIEANTTAEVMALTADYLSKPENAYALVPMMVDTEGAQKLIGEYNAAILERSELLSSARPDNTALKLLSERIDQMRENVSQTLGRALASQRVAASELAKELASTEGYLKDMPQTEREYIDLEREHRVKQELYLFLLQKREENSLMMANAQPKGQVIDSAYTLIDTVGLGKKAIILLSLIFGMCLPPIFLYCMRLVRNRFESRQDVERLTDVPILGEVCVDHTGRKLVVDSTDTSSTVELFRLMRANLLFVLNDANDKVVLVTSSVSGEGKSFISSNLAATLALTGKRVVLVGMDIRNPRIAQYMSVNPQFGLTQYLSSSSISLQQIIVPAPTVANLDIIVGGPVPPNPAELLISEKVDEFFSKLRQLYDYIIVDTAPIGMVSDTFTLNRIADAAIYVCRANYTSLHDLMEVNDIFEQKRLKKLSIVVNGTKTKKTYGYGAKKK